MAIKTVIFDIGNVLVDFCWEKHYKSFGYSEEIFQRLAKATVYDDMWNQFDKGVLSEQEMLDIFIHNDPEIEQEIRTVFQNVSGTIEVYDYAYDWIHELQDKGYQVLILSNFSEKCFRECGTKMDFVKEADGAVISYIERMIKPDDEIYELLLTRYHLNPEECVFMDDKQENVTAAEKHGIHGIVFQNRADAIRQMAELGMQL